MKSSQGSKKNFQEAIEANLEEPHDAIKKIRIKNISKKLPELIDEYGKTKVFLAIFMDNRKGVRALGRTLWDKYSEPTEKVVEESNLNNDAVKTTDQCSVQNVSTPINKLQRSLQKAEKKIIDVKEQHRKIVSDRDKKIFEQKKRLVELEKQIKVKGQEVNCLNDRLLENKKQITRLEGALSSMSGQIRKLNQLREDDALIIKELRDQLERAEKIASEVEVPIQKQVEDNEDFDFVITVQGEFVYSSPSGWVVSDQGIFNISEELVSQHQLVTGDAVEIKMDGSQGDIEVKIIEKVETKEQAGFIVWEDEDYWVKCGTEMILVGFQEVFRVGASEGDPVSVLVPANKPTAKGRITKIHWVSLVRDIATHLDKPKRIEKKAKKAVFSNSLSGSKVMVLGGDGVKNSYIRELQQMGAEVEWHTGFNEMHAIPHKVGRADVVLVLTAHMSHKAYYVLKAAAKAYNKQPLYYNGLSIKGAAVAVAGFCQKQNELSLIS